MVVQEFKNYVSHVTRKQDYCLCENKGADQLCSNCTDDQHLCFHYKGSTNPLLFISKIPSIKHFSVSVLVGLGQSWSETPVFWCHGSCGICFQVCDSHIIISVISSLTCNL